MVRVEPTLTLRLELHSKTAQAVTLAFWDLAEDKNAGYQGTETQPRWKFAPERWKDADETLLTRENSGLTGIDADTFGVPSASPRPAFDGAAYASKLPGTTMVLAPVLSWI